MVEILSPARDFDCLKGAVLYGADAVYLGLDRFSMRSSRGFDEGNLAAAIEYAHARGVKVYVTLNTTPQANETEQLSEYFGIVKSANADAVIAGDIGTLDLAAKAGLTVHASVQAGCANAETARVLQSLGASRVVLARELSLEQIDYITKHGPSGMEYEAFVHGAVCMAMSGRCNISAYLTGRNANSGACAQPCRWNYKTYIEEEKRENTLFEVAEKDGYVEVLSSGDLCMIEHLAELERAGISSFKIEGRSKSYYYTCVVTNAYKNADKPWALRETQLVSHRDYDTGFYFGIPPCHTVGNNQAYIRNAEIVAIVLRQDGGMLDCVQRNNFKAGDSLEIVVPGKPPISFVVSDMYDESGAAIFVAPHAEMRVRIPFDGDVPQGCVIRRG
jgi:Collagenase and related proteases